MSVTMMFSDTIAINQDLDSTVLPYVMLKEMNLLILWNTDYTEFTISQCPLLVTSLMITTEL